MKGTSAIKDIIIDAEKRGEEIAISTVTSLELLQHVLHKKLTSHERRRCEQANPVRRGLLDNR
ncbi:MAG: hypothetical protein HYW93_00610 [Thaumarchaeota archaeon]|nr:hypothetical protein [Nitrososphaerota archaeon]